MTNQTCQNKDYNRFYRKGLTMTALNPLYFKGPLKETRPEDGYATDDGLQTGNRNLNVDGSSGAVTFWLPVAEDAIIQVFQISLSLVDNGTPGFGDFANISNGLTNGVQVFYDKNGTTFNGSLYKTNENLITESSSHNFINYSGNNEAHIYRDDLMSHSNGIVLHGATNDRIGAIVNDDLTSIAHFNCFYRYHVRSIN